MSKKRRKERSMETNTETTHIVEQELDEVTNPLAGHDEDPAESYEDLVPVGTAEVVEEEAPAEEVPSDEEPPPIEEPKAVVQEAPIEPPVDAQPVDDERAALIAKLEAMAAMIAELQGKTATSKSSAAGAGSKPRATVIYKLLTKVPAASKTPQVNAIQTILFAPEVAKQYTDPADGMVKIPEPELFELIEAGAAAGKLNTRQKPVRIFQYYRSQLLQSGVLLWSNA